MTQTPLVEAWHTAGFLVSQANGHRSIDKAVLTGSARVLAGTVLGKKTTGSTAAAAALGTNTGNGTFGAITTVTVPTQIGAYTLLMTAATTFTVTAPNGATATGSTGVAFNSLGLGFTLTAGGTAFVAGDSFTLTTTATAGNPSVASVAGTNTGNGTFGAFTTTVAPQVGMYIVEFDDATHFVVNSPAGVEVGHGTTGSAFAAGGLGFTITAGGTAFVPGDSFQVTVTAGSSSYVTSVRTAVDGSQTPAGILYATTDATLADQSCAVVVRGAEVNGNELIWDSSYSAAEIAKGVAQLNSIGVIVRT